MHAALRPFGHAADLDLDFVQSDRPALVTALLAQCSEDGDSAFWWSQPVGIRTTALLQIVGATDAERQIGFTARCSQARCGETFEFELALQALPDACADIGAFRIELDDARSVTLRRATGHDLRAWHTAQPASRAEALGIMLAGLLLEGQVQPQDEAALSEALAARDPLVAFSVACACPACGAPNHVAVDLEEVALARLAARQRALLREVHDLALHYGWTEQEALAVPQQRRAHYLALIEEAR